MSLWRRRAREKLRPKTGILLGSDSDERNGFLNVRWVLAITGLVARCDHVWPGVTSVSRKLNAPRAIGETGPRTPLGVVTWEEEQRERNAFVVQLGVPSPSAAYFDARSCA